MTARRGVRRLARLGLAGALAGMVGGGCAKGGAGGSAAASSSLGTLCQTDADCPRGGVCVNANHQTGALLECNARRDAGLLCVSQAQDGPSLLWQSGYCSPRCKTDQDCVAGPVVGACQLRIVGASLDLTGGEDAGDGVCLIPCFASLGCPESFECRRGMSCAGAGPAGATQACVPCDGAAPDGGDLDGPPAGDAAGTPAVWTCPAAWYAAGDGCDCGCGAVDPDCADATAASCDSCDVSQGACGACGAVDPADNARCASGRAGWTCAPTWFGDGVCDCGCGVTDPDCATASITACARCRGAADGGCNGTAGVCPGTIDPRDNAACVDLRGWRCAAAAYGDGTCDCGCGIVDADCADATAASCDSCPPEGCSGSGFPCPGAISPRNNAICAAALAGWTCAPSLYADGVCDCGCGAVDSDCPNASAASCRACRGYADGGCNGTDPTCPGAISPSSNATCGGATGWTCSSKFYGSGDGICDCGCGAVDPDCGTRSASRCDFCHDALDGGCNASGVACPGSINQNDNATCQ